MVPETHAHTHTQTMDHSCLKQWMNEASLQRKMNQLFFLFTYSSLSLYHLPNNIRSHRLLFFFSHLYSLWFYDVDDDLNDDEHQKKIRKEAKKRNKIAIDIYSGWYHHIKQKKINKQTNQTLRRFFSRWNEECSKDNDNDNVIQSF